MADKMATREAYGNTLKELGMKFQSLNSVFSGICDRFSGCFFCLSHYREAVVCFVEEKQENNDLILELSGNRAGTGSSVLKIKNQYNEQIAIVLSVNVNDSLKWIIIILSVAAAVIAAGVIVCLLIHPKLNGSVYISMIFQFLF